MTGKYVSVVTSEHRLLSRFATGVRRDLVGLVTDRSAVFGIAKREYRDCRVKYRQHRWVLDVLGYCCDVSWPEGVVNWTNAGWYPEH